MSVWYVIGTGAGVLTLGGIAYWTVKNRRGIMTPERRQQYHTAMNVTLDTNELRNVAAMFSGEGLHKQAADINKRIKLREMPPEKKKARREVYNKVLSCTDADKVERVAKAFEKEGATGCAAELRKYADSLRHAAAE